MSKRENALIVDALGSALSDQMQAYAQVPRLIIRLEETGAWKEFETKMGQHVTYTNFEDFVTNPPLKGLGVTVDLIQNIVQDNPEARIALSKMSRMSHGGDRKSEDFRIKPLIQGLDSEVEKKKERYGELDLQLAKKDPERYEQYKSGNMTLTAAAIAAKIYPPRIAVNLSNPESAAKTLLTHASPEFIDELLRILTKEQS